MRLVKFKRKLEGKYQVFLRDVSREINEEYHLLAQCIRSDQVPAAAIVEHLKDEGFRKYYYEEFYDTLHFDYPNS
jgi:hypothetical protein